jgi:hypothetical protein
MLLIIFGAGASFDSVPSRRIKESDFQSPQQYSLNKYSSRPPLANQLFEERDLFAETLEKYPDCLAVVPQLRELGNRQLEQVLEELQIASELYRRGHQQLAAVRYYLHDMLWTCGEKWLREARGVTNYRTLLDKIDRSRKPEETVALVTFNYDTLLEPGLRDLGFNIKQISDYVLQNPNYKIFKVHGSVNWGRVVGIVGLERHAHDNHPEATILHMISIVEKLQVTDSYVLTPTHPMSWVEGQPVFPAIAIPVRSKSDFECPKEHLDHLWKFLPEVTKVIVVGWRGTELHFLRRLDELLPKRVFFYIVAGSEKAALEVKQTLEQSLENSRQLEIALDKDGFTEFVVNGRADEVLQMKYP